MGFKLSKFIIALILASLIVTAFGGLIGDLSGKYTSASYNQSDIEVYNTLQETQNLTHRLQSKIENQTTDVGVTDLIGNFIGDAVDSMRLAKNSYTTFFTMADNGIDKVGLPGMFKTALFSIVLILILFTIVSAMIKKDL